MQTPTLAMLADLDSKIVRFRKEKCHHVRLALEETEAVSDRIVSPEDRDLLAAVQESPFQPTTLEQFREFPANTEYFVLEPNIRKVEDVGWRYLA